MKEDADADADEDEDEDDTRHGQLDDNMANDASR